MAQIGQFTRTPSGYSGRIRTLSLDIELTFTPAENAEADKAPAYRIHLGDEDGPEVGAGWKHSGERAGPFVSVVLDDPVFQQRDPRPPVPVGRGGPRLGPALDPSEEARRTGMIMVMSYTRPTSGRCGARRRILLLLLSGLFIPVITTPQVLAQTTAPDRAVAAHPHGAHIEEASQRFGIPASWIIAVMQVESAGDMRAISSAGAMGLMQVMPDTWAELRIRHALGRDPFEPRDNILAGTAYLREMWDRYGNVAAMLAAYNAGPGRYDEYLSTARPLPAETRAYVAALTPILLGERPSGSGSSVAAPLDWREAALLVAREIGASAADSASRDRASDDAPSLVPAKPDALTALQPEGLFVARDAGGGRP